MANKIKVTFGDGSRRTLKAPGELKDIDNTREARFVMDNWQVYSGWCNGEVDEDGDFCILRTLHDIGLPFNRLLGWCYVSAKR